MWQSFVRPIDVSKSVSAVRLMEWKKEESIYGMTSSQQALSDIRVNLIVSTWNLTIWNLKNARESFVDYAEVKLSVCPQAFYNWAESWSL